MLIPYVVPACSMTQICRYSGLELQKYHTAEQQKNEA